MDGKDAVIEPPAHELTTLRQQITEPEQLEPERRKAEDTLRKSEQRFRSLVEMTSDWIWEINGDGFYTYSSPKVKDLLGYTPDEIVGKTPFDLMPEDEARRVRTLFKDILKSRRAFSGLENVCLHRDGREVTLETSGVPIFDADGNLSGYRGIDRDITKRKQAEGALGRERDFTETVLSTAKTLVVVLDPEGRIVRFNRACEHLTGYTFDEVRNVPLWDIFLIPEEVEGIRAVFAELREGQFPNEHENYWVAKDRNLHLIRWSNTALCAEDGSIEYVIGTGIDITGYKRSEETLRFTQFAIDKTIDQAFWMTNDGHLFYVNEAACRALGYSREELLKMSVPEIDPACPPEVFTGYWRDLQEKGSDTFETLHRAKDGRVYPVEIRSNYMLFDGKEYNCAFATDITERKRAEEALQEAHGKLELRVQERTAELREAYERLEAETAERKQVEAQLLQSQKMEAIGTLAGGIAHDFNNILAAIIGFGEMIEENLPPESHNFRYIQRVLSAASRGKDLVEQILAFSRKTGLTRTPLPLSPLVKETVQLLRASLPSTIEIKLTMKAGKDAILASSSEFQQVLMNLATNASYAMRENGGILGISVTNVDFEPDSAVLDSDIDVEPGEYVQVAVTDTGTGMAPEVMKRVFEPFFTTKGVGEGTGMGLAVVYGIVKGLNGDISVESEPGEGSTFRVFFPVARTDEKPENRGAQAPPKGSERILFVDDEEFLMEWGQAVLESLGYTPVALVDSNEALKLFSNDPSSFDLVILDQTMPNLTGLRLARRLLKIRSDIPIILCTGYSDSVSPEKAKEAGIREFLMKPLGKQALATAVRRALDKEG